MKKTLIDWPALIEQQKHSGVSQKKFCVERGVTYSSFGYRKKRLGKVSSAIEISRPKFIELDLSTSVLPQRGHEDLVVELSFGVVMHFRGISR